MRIRPQTLVILAGFASAAMASWATMNVPLQEDPAEPSKREIAQRVSRSHAELYLEAVLQKNDRLVREHGAKSMRADIESIGSLFDQYFGDKNDLTEVELDLIEAFLYKSFYWTVNTEPRDSPASVGKNTHGVGKVFFVLDSRKRTGTIQVERNGKSAKIVTVQSAGGLSFGERAKMIQKRFEEVQKNSNWWVGDRLYVTTQKGSQVIRSKDYSRDILVTASSKDAKSRNLSEKAYAETIRREIREVMGRLKK